MIRLNQTTTIFASVLVILQLVTPTPPAYSQGQQSRQSIEMDRVDSLLRVSSSILSSKPAMELESAIHHEISRDSGLKEVAVLERSIVKNEAQIASLASRNLLLRTRLKALQEREDSSAQDLSDLSRKIDAIQDNISRTQDENARLRRQKDALFHAKLMGAALTGVSLILQIQGIKDATQRLKIKEIDLSRRQATLIDPKTGGPGPDVQKLRILEERAVGAKNLLNRAQANGAAASDVLRAEQRALEAAAELEQWKSVVSGTEQKIAESRITAKIDARSILRQKISVGITSVATLIIGLFGDRILLKIEEWLESDDPHDQEERMLGYLRRWQAPRVMLSSMLPALERRDLEPWDKAVLFFADSKLLHLRAGVLERALERYKDEDPRGFRALQAMAEMRLKAELAEEVAHVRRALLIQKEVRDQLEKGVLPLSASRTNSIDGTYVKKTFVPPQQRAKAKKKRSWLRSLFRSLLNGF